jgi:hypothetical protein
VIDQEKCLAYSTAAQQMATLHADDEIARLMINTMEKRK